ncbi:MAG: NYN domain-containing protein [Deltaproteobacteria bacterium]|jgi:uncharacterized LabA/DUF88 family protein
MANGTDPNSAIAVLIDADNANPSIVEGLLAEVAKFGSASVKRIYGDWTTPNLASWKSILLEFSIQPIQQFRYTTGKNATDSAMIIDAMDLLYTGKLSGFCLVSSDSDFTRLASRIRESGLWVYGFGERKTPRAFVSACDRFIYTDVFVQSRDKVIDEVLKPHSSKKLRSNTKLLNLVRSAINAGSDDTGWAQLAPVGSYINKTANDFDPRNYGFSKLSGLIKAIGLFEIDRRGNLIYVRDSRIKDKK